VPEPTRPLNGRVAPPNDLPSTLDYLKMCAQLSRKLQWAIGTTYADQMGHRLPKRLCDSMADQYAMLITEGLKALIETHTKNTQ